MWNHVATDESAIAIETAIRLPNALVGAATAAVLFGVCDVLFGTRGRDDGGAPLGARRQRHRHQPHRQGGHLRAVLLSRRRVVLRASEAAGRDRSRRRAALVHGQRRGIRPDARVEVLPAVPGPLRAVQPRDRSRPGREPARQGALLRRDGRRVSDRERRDPRSRHVAVRRHLLQRRHAAPPRVSIRRPAVPEHVVFSSPDGIPATFYLRMLATKVPLVVLGALVPGRDRDCCATAANAGSSC